MTEQVVINEVAFKLALKQTRMEEGRTVDACRDVLVHALSGSEAARKHGISKQAVSQAVKRIKESALKLGACPMCGRPSISTIPNIMGHAH